MDEGGGEMSFPTNLQGLFIDGQWAAGSEHLRVINPATEALLTTVNGGDARAVDHAVQAATAAFSEWSQTTGAERGAILRNIAAGVQAAREQLMNLQSSNNGKPLFEAAIDVDDVIATFEYYAGLAEALDAQQDTAVQLPSESDLLRSCVVLLGDRVDRSVKRLALLAARDRARVPG